MIVKIMSKQREKGCEDVGWWLFEVYFRWSKWSWRFPFNQHGTRSLQNPMVTQHCHAPTNMEKHLPLVSHVDTDMGIDIWSAFQWNNIDCVPVITWKVSATGPMSCHVSWLTSLYKGRCSHLPLQKSLVVFLLCVYRPKCGSPLSYRF